MLQLATSSVAKLLVATPTGDTRNLATDEVDPPEQLMHATRP